MQIKILGCSGGIGGDFRTSSILVDDDILLDAGSGVGDLSMDELLKIDHIFITHSHLDHIAFIPFLIDTVMGIRPNPVTLHATKETLAILRAHIFNWEIWPDFNVIPSPESPFLRYHEMEVGKAVELEGRRFTPVPVSHGIPAVGYHVEGAQHSLIYTGDTSTCDALWTVANQISNLKYLIIETAFSNAELALAKVSKHLCPSLVLDELAKLDLSGFDEVLEVYITHLKPGEEQAIMSEILAHNAGMPIKALQNNQVFML